MVVGLVGSLARLMADYLAGLKAASKVKQMADNLVVTMVGK